MSFSFFIFFFFFLIDFRWLSALKLLLSSYKTRTNTEHFGEDISLMFSQQYGPCPFLSEDLFFIPADNGDIQELLKLPHLHCTASATVKNHKAGWSKYKQWFTAAVSFCPFFHWALYSCLILSMGLTTENSLSFKSKRVQFCVVISTCHSWTPFLQVS